MSRVMILLSSLVVAATISLTAQSTSTYLGRPPGAAFMEVWHSQRQAVILYRDVKSVSEASVLLLTQDGRQLLSLSPLKDLLDPEARVVNIWAATGAPDGGIVLAATLLNRATTANGGRAEGLRQVLMIYNSAGSLIKLWDVYPYHHHALAVDRDGSVYALGHRLDAVPSPSYATIIKYSPRGVVAGEYLRMGPELGVRDFSDMFHGSESAIWIDPEGMSVYIGGLSRLYRLDRIGRIETLQDLTPMLADVAARLGAASAAVSGLAPMRSGSAAFQLTLRSQLPRGPSRWLVAELGRGAKSMSPITQVQNYEWARTRLVTVGDNGAMFICKDRDLRMNLVRIPLSR